MSGVLDLMNESVFPDLNCAKLREVGGRRCGFLQAIKLCRFWFSIFNVFIKIPTFLLSLHGCTQGTVPRPLSETNRSTTATKENNYNECLRQFCGFLSSDRLSRECSQPKAFSPNCQWCSWICTAFCVFAFLAKRGQCNFRKSSTLLVCPDKLQMSSAFWRTEFFVSIFILQVSWNVWNFILFKGTLQALARCHVKKFFRNCFTADACNRTTYPQNCLNDATASRWRWCLHSNSSVQIWSCSLNSRWQLSSAASVLSKDILIISLNVYSSCFLTLSLST